MHRRPRDTVDAAAESRAAAEKVVKELQVVTDSLSSTSRRLNSADDERTTSQTAGYAAAVVMATILAWLVVSDAVAFVAAMNIVAY